MGWDGMLIPLLLTVGIVNICATPSYCIDQVAHRIFNRRIGGCLGESKVLSELSTLKNRNIAEYQRAHELLAYHYFAVQSNPNRKLDCSSADFEYVPLLPLAWKTGLSITTECTLGGKCSHLPPDSSMCGIDEVVRSILEYMKYVSSRPATISRPRFIVSSMYHLKLVLGYGMPTQQRRGSAYATMTSFIETTMVGHYERLPVCSDLLRRPWRHVVELPYLVHDKYRDHADSGVSMPLAVGAGNKLWSFFFAGRLVLWGSERVCSVRISVAESLGSRSDSVIFNISSSQAQGTPIANESFYHAMRDSTFCVIAKADSYSSASFYNAMQAGCLPVVISDWFIFSFWWLIPYSEFVVRIREDVFLMNPNGVLNAVLKMYSKDDLKRMQEAMLKYTTFLDFGTTHTHTLMSPFDAMLIEMQQAENELTNNTSQVPFVDSKTPPSVLCRNPKSCAWMWEASPHPLQLPRLEDTRRHLCQHSPRIIGKYKIVYFLQCIKMLWPLRPGNLLPRDLAPGALSPADITFINVFHNLSQHGSGYYWQVYPSMENNMHIRNIMLP